MRILRMVFFAALSGVLLPLALPNELFPWGNPALGLIALVPLYLAIDGARSFKGAFLYSAIFGGLAHGLSSYWLWFFQDFRVWTLGSSIVAYMLVYGVLGLYLRGALKRGGLARTIAFAAVWSVFEWSKSNGFLGYPWGLLPYSWNTVLPAIQIVESTGVYGLSFMLAWISASAGELLSPPDEALPPVTYPLDALRLAARIFPQRPVAGPCRACLALGHLVAALVLLIGILGYGSVALARQREPRGLLRAIMVQQNVDSWGVVGGELASLDISLALARRAIGEADAKPDVVLFSETTLRRDYDDFVRYFARMPPSDPLGPFLAEHNVSLFTGAPELFYVDDELEATNAVILIGPDGRKRASYAKMHAVPFAEAIPFWDVPAVRNFIQNVVGLESGWSMGTERTVFELPTREAGTVRFSAPICFEDAFSYLCRRFVLDGAEILINLTNDSWSLTRSAEIQHFVASRFRSVELRRTLVRSTNGGVSAVVLPDGSISDILPLFQADARAVNVPVYTGEITPYLAFGDWFPVVLAFLLGLGSIIVYIDDVRAARAGGRKAHHERP
ncbi:MAG: apolipoprotein N-acyltransferase [Spirochaetales bacterium]|nr:MAG: apolipoprotein N-acyltransferase [Spirochaetales bacterium]